MLVCICARIARHGAKGIGVVSVTAPVTVETACDNAGRVLPQKGRFEPDDGVDRRVPRELGIDDVHLDGPGNGLSKG